MNATLDLIRLGAVAGAGLTVGLGAVLGGAPDPGRATPAVVAIAGIVAAANIHNDRCDIEADRLNRRNRPLADGRMEDAQARTVFWGSTAVGIVAALTLGIGPLAAAVGLWVLGIAYSGPVRRVPLVGHLVVASLFAAVVFFGVLATGGSYHLDVWMAAAIVLLFIGLREVLKAIPDVAGDRAIGARTVAVVLGPDRSLRLVWGLIAGLIGVTCIHVALVGSWLFGVAVAVGIVVPALALGRVIWLSPDDATIRRAASWASLVFLTGQAALMVLAVVAPRVA